MLEGSLKSGNFEIPISKIVLGTYGYGTNYSMNDSFALLDYYYSKGGRTIDTAKVYGIENDADISPSESTVGAWVESRGVRRDITLVTKGGHPHINGARSSRLTAQEILSDIGQSLEALKTNSIDIYFLHRDNESIQVEQLVDTMDMLVKKGYTKSYGVSNWTVSRINAANEYAAKSGKAPISVSQIQWGLARTTPEDIGDNTLVCMNDREYEGYKKNKMPVLAFSSQSKGLFSKYISGGPESLNPKIMQRFFNKRNITLVNRVKLLSEKCGVSPASIVLAYITGNPVEGYAIIGCSGVAQLKDSLSNPDFKLSKDDFEYLDKV